MKSIPIEKAIEIALEQHKAGNFTRAEALYMEILRQDPGNVDAMHLLGVLAHQGKRPDMAVQLIQAAIGRRGDVPIFHYNLAEALMAEHRGQDAVAAYRNALELAPEYFEAHNNLANALNGMSQYADAEAACRAAIAIRPTDAAPWNNLGNALRGEGRADEALAAFNKAVELRPGFVEAMSNRAMCLCWMNRLEDGVAEFRKAISLNPALPDAHNNLGTALTHLGRLEEAGAEFQMAIDLKADHVEAINNLGSTLLSLGKSLEAIALFEKAVEINPDFATAHANLASAFSQNMRHEDALKEISRALEISPRSAKNHFLHGVILRDMHRMDEGIESIRESLRIEPNFVPALTGLGYALLERGETEEAMVSLKKSIELKPDAQTHSNVLLTINYHPGYSPADLLEAHKSWAELHEKPTISQWKPHSNNRDPDRKLRIGYVSPDFRGHSVSYFLEPILANHNLEQFEIFGYANTANVDLHTWRLRAQLSQWREIAPGRPDEVAEQIRVDQIDILVDLAGHTGGNALTTFARKPAPVQMNMIGFPSTTGLTAIDYRVTDSICDPSGVADAMNSEALLRLDPVFWCYLPPPGVADVGELPAKTDGTITFTSVNNFTKVTPEVQRLWARILAAIPNSRLILQTSAMSSEHTRNNLIALFGQAGVAKDRLEFRPWSDFTQYMNLLERSDMTLDPFPFNGGTTTCHSLWMGAPVITLAGDRHASRMGLSMMTAIGLPEFVAATPQEYVDIAVRFAKDLPRLAEIRAGMRQRLQNSPLLDAAGYTGNLESAYRSVWRKWCATGT